MKLQSVSSRLILYISFNENFERPAEVSCRSLQVNQVKNQVQKF